MVALLLPAVLFIAYSYYNYRLNAISDEVVFSISSINKNTVNRYESMWTWKSMQSKNDREKLASKFRKELQYLSTVPFVICADFTETDSKQILGSWPVPECSIIKKESTRVSTEITNGTTFHLHYNHLYPAKIANEEI